LNIGYIVDTDWAIHCLRGVDDIRSKLNELRTGGLGISVVSVAELYEGVYRARDTHTAEQHLNTLLSGMTIVPFTHEISKIFGRERARLRPQNQLIGDIDLIIAATALHYQIPVCTNNRDHFLRVSGLQVIST